MTSKPNPMMRLMAIGGVIMMLILWACSKCHAATPPANTPRISVIADTNGVLLFPTNLFHTNIAALRAELGALAGSNTADFYPASNPSNYVTTTNWAVNQVSNAGTAAYSNASAFYLVSNPSNFTTTTNWQLGQITNANHLTNWALLPTNVHVRVSGDTMTGPLTNNSGIYGNGIGETNIPLSALQTVPLTNGQTGVTHGFAGTNTFAAESDVSFIRKAITTLANGNNAGVLIGTNVFVDVSGPSGAFTINGLNGSPNRDGKMLFLLNQTGQNMTIAHESGVDPTAGNRIQTLTAADKTVTGNSAAILVYKSSVSRWILLYFGQ